MINDELESELARVRQALANSIAVEKQIELQLKKIKEQMQSWDKRAEMASESDHQEMATQAQERSKQLKAQENELEIELMSQRDFTASLKKDLSKLESRRFSGTTSGAEALKATDNTLSTIQRMEKKIASHEAMAELTTDKVERKFAADERKDDIEEELQRLKSAQKKDQ